MKPRARKRASRPGLPAMEICHEFGFDAAHHFPGVPRLPSGFVHDFARLEKACLRLRDKLDHALLNEIAGLNNPSLENLCVWTWGRLAPQFPGLARVTVRRDSLGQSCTYLGPGADR